MIVTKAGGNGHLDIEAVCTDIAELVQQSRGDTENSAINPDILSGNINIWITRHFSFVGIV